MPIDAGLDDLAKGQVRGGMAASTTARGMPVASGTVTYKTPKEATMSTGGLWTPSGRGRILADGAALGNRVAVLLSRGARY